MVSPLAPFSSPHALLNTTRQRLQASLSWRELAVEMRRDSQHLRHQAAQLRQWSREVRAQKARLRAESVALCQTRERPESAVHHNAALSPDGVQVAMLHQNARATV